MSFRQRLLGGFLGMGALLGTTAALAAEGLWYTADGAAQVEIAACGEALCGAIVWLEEPLDEDGEPKRDTHNPDPDQRDREILGLRILWDMAPVQGREQWEDGRLYDTRSGKTYRGRMTLEDENTLDMRGYVGRPLFGRSTTWTRVVEGE